MTRDKHHTALASGGISDDAAYAFAAQDFLAEMRAPRRVLDLGCGAGNFGAWLRARGSGAWIDGMDLVRYKDFATAAYRTFYEADLDGDFAAITSERYDYIFANEVIHSLENPRAFLRQAARLLAPGGTLVFTTPNPLCLPSLLLLATRGTSRNFLDGPGRYPSQITPLLPLDAERMVREVGLQFVARSFDRKCRLWRRWRVQSLLPFFGGRFFSDHYRCIARAGD